MMKSIYIWLGMHFLLLVACHQKEDQLKVTVEIEPYRKENCVHMCHQLKVSINNHTEDSIYLPFTYLSIYLYVTDEKGQEYNYLDFASEESTYYQDHVKPVFSDSSVQVYDGPFLMEYDTVQLSYQQQYSKYYESFVEKAANKELEEIMKENNLNTTTSSDSVFCLEDWLKVKYSNVVLLGPKESIYEILNIDTMVGKGYKVSFRYEYFNKDEDPLHIYLDEPKKAVEIRSDYPEKVNGYKLFEGVIESEIVELK